jgi:hypothetical protein
MAYAGRCGDNSGPCPIDRDLLAQMVVAAGALILMTTSASAAILNRMRTSHRLLACGLGLYLAWIALLLVLFGLPSGWGGPLRTRSASSAPAPESMRRCVHDCVGGQLRAQAVGVDHQVVVAWALSGDAVEAFDVVGPVGISA